MMSAQSQGYAREPLLLAQNDDSLSDLEDYKLENTLNTSRRHRYVDHVLNLNWRAPLRRSRSWPRQALDRVPVLRIYLKAFLYALVPQLIRRKCFNEPATATKIHSTSWMDGIRGLAAVCVFTKHYLARYTTTIFRGYGTTPADTWIHQLPVFNLFYDGWSGLILFFIIGGYVCSYKPLQAIANGDHTALVKSLGKSVLGRWPRLYLPLLCYTFTHCALAYVGAYEPAHWLFTFDDPSKVMPGRPLEGHRPRLPLLRQIGYWITASAETMNFWTEFPNTPRVGAHLWAILEMFRGSMHLYVIIIALAICKPWARVFVLAVVSYIYLGFLQHWAPVTFFCGAILAQIDVMRLRREKEREQSGQSSKDNENEYAEKENDLFDAEAQRRLPYSSLLRRFNITLIFQHQRGNTPTLRLVLYVVALFLMGFGQVGARYYASVYASVVNPLIPNFFDAENGHIFPKSIGVSLLMWLLSTVPMKDRARSIWHRILTFGFCQYLGRIMFALYLLHPMVFRLYGYALPALFWRRWSAETNAWEYDVPEDLITYLAGVIFGWAGGFLGVLWLSDCWSREVEARCMMFTAMIERWLCMKK